MAAGTAAAAAPAAFTDAERARITVPVEIAAQPLSQALAAFAQETRLQLVYESSLAVDRRAARIPAGLPADQALARLLSGTGLEFTFLNDRTVKIYAPPPTSGSERHPSPTGPSASTAPFTVETLDELVITATKREESLATVPISVAVLTGDELSFEGVGGVADIAALTPGMQFAFDSQYGSALITNVAIRGLSTGRGAPTTGVYVDDVPIQASQNSFRTAYPAVFDLARVEVLRGPQGTLFGSNAPGGAVRYITREASTMEATASSRVEVSSTEHGGTSFEGGVAIGGPLAQERVGGSLSVWYRSQGGYIDRIDPFDDTVLDRDANRSTDKAVHGGLVIEPTESLRITPSVTYQSTDLHDTPVFFPGAGILRNGKLLRQPHADSFTLAAVRLVLSLGAVELTSVSAHFDRRATATVDQTNAACVVYFGDCGNPLGPAYPASYAQAIPTRLEQHQFALSQEVRLASSAPDAPLSWLAGLFYWRTHENGIRKTYAMFAPGTPVIDSAKYFYGAEISGFGEAHVALSPRWRMGAGMRRGWSRGDATDYETGIANTDAPFSHSVGGFAPLPTSLRFDLSYRADAHNFFYAAISRGGRSGGGNSLGQCGATAVPASFSSDVILNYEVGAKNLLFDGRLQLDASLFRIRWRDIQEHVYDTCGNGYDTNAGSATSAGFDLSADAVVTERLRLHLALGLTDARYDRTVLTANGQVVVDRGAALGPLPSVTPPWNGTVSLQYRQPLASGKVAYAAAADSFSSHNPGPFTESDPRALSYVPGWRADPATNRLDLRLGVATASGLDIRLSVYNVLNAQPVLYRTADTLGSSLLYAATFRPRTFALTADWKLGFGATE